MSGVTLKRRIDCAGSVKVTVFMSLCHLVNKNSKIDTYEQTVIDR